MIEATLGPTFWSYVRFIEENIHEMETRPMQTQCLHLMGALEMVPFHFASEMIPPKGSKGKSIELIYPLTYPQIAKAFSCLRSALCYGRYHEDTRLLNTGKHETDTSLVPSYVKW